MIARGPRESDRSLRAQENVCLACFGVARCHFLQISGAFHILAESLTFESSFYGVACVASTLSGHSVCDLHYVRKDSMRYLRIDN